MIVRIFTGISTFIGDAVDNYKYKKWLKVDSMVVLQQSVSVRTVDIILK